MLRRQSNWSYKSAIIHINANTIPDPCKNYLTDYYLECNRSFQKIASLYVCITEKVRKQTLPKEHSRYTTQFMLCIFGRYVLVLVGR